MLTGHLGAERSVDFIRRRLRFSGKSSLLFALLSITLCGCGEDTPDRLRPNIPRGIPTGETVYYNTKWFECSVAIYQLDPIFAEEVRRNGLLSLNTATSSSWSETPTFKETAGHGRWEADLEESLDCIADDKLQTLFRQTSADGGYFQVQNSNSTTLIAPYNGLMMVGGYE